MGRTVSKAASNRLQQLQDTSEQPAAQKTRYSCGSLGPRKAGKAVSARWLHARIRVPHRSGSVLARGETAPRLALARARRVSGTNSPHLVGGARATARIFLDWRAAREAPPRARSRFILSPPGFRELPIRPGATHRFARPRNLLARKRFTSRGNASPQTHAGSRRDYTKTTRKKTRRADQPWVSPSPASGSACSARRRCVDSCAEIKILRRVRAESPRRPPRHRRDASSMARRCGLSPPDSANTAAFSPRTDLVKNYRVHPTHGLINA